MYYNHVCTLPDQELKLNKFSQKIINLTHITTKHPRTKFYFRSIASIEKEKKKQLNLKQKWIIHPLSTFRMYWEAFMVVILFGSVYVTNVNLMIMRPIPAPTDPFDKFDGHVWWEIVCDYMVFLDIVLALMTGVCKPQQHIILLQPKQIVRHYMKQFLFYVFLITSTPTYLISKIVSNIDESYRKSKVLRALELTGFLKTVRILKFVEYYQNVTELMRHHHYTRFALKYLLIIPLMIHSFAAFYICVLQAVIYFNPFEEYVGPSLHARFILEFSFYNIYTKAMEVVTAYLLGIPAHTGYKTEPRDRIESTHAILLFLIIAPIGYVCCNLLFVMTLQMLLSMNSSSIKYNEIISQLRKYLKHKDLPHSINARILSYYDYRFQKKYFRESSILTMLSETLRREINLHSCRKLIESVPLLRDLPSEIIAEVVGNLTHEVFLYNDMIVKAGTVGDCMYFIANGTVAVSTPTGKEICHLQDGAYFGEIALIAKDQKRVANVVAIEICQIYRLDRRNFRTCFPSNSVFYKKIEQIARERMEKTVLLEQLHKKYVLERSTKKSAYFRKSSVSRDAT